MNNAMTKFQEMCEEVESPGAAEWTDYECDAFLAEAEKAFANGEMTRGQYWELAALVG